MEISRQNKWITLQPTHYSQSLQLWRVHDLEKLVWEIAIKIIIVAVVPADYPVSVSCTEITMEYKCHFVLCCNLGIYI